MSADPAVVDPAVVDPAVVEAVVAAYFDAIGRGDNAPDFFTIDVDAGCIQRLVIYSGGPA